MDFPLPTFQIQLRYLKNSSRYVNLTPTDVKQLCLVSIIVELLGVEQTKQKFGEIYVAIRPFNF